jgi:dihydromethanopterin reductase (acceptor)
MKIAWCITGAGHFLEESYEVFRTIKRGVRPGASNLKPQTSNLTISTFISNAGVEVLRMYGIFDKLKEISNGDYMAEIFTEKEQGSSSPKAGRFSLRKYDAVVVSPATSNTVAKIAYGIADSLVTNVVSLAMKACVPVYIVPTDGSPGKVESEMPYSIDRDKCRGCDDCEPRDSCEKEAICGVPIPQIDLLRCDGCGLCSELCPYDAINGGVVEIKAREIDIKNVDLLREMEGMIILEHPKHFLSFPKKEPVLRKKNF